MKLPEPCSTPMLTSMNLIKSETATTANSDGNDIGICINCEHAQLDIKEAPCASCSNNEELFKNFVKASDKQESRMCGTCRNNPHMTQQTTSISVDNQGLPCRVCVSDYFYHPVSG